MTTPDIKTAAPLIKAEVDRARNILLHLHYSPDPDSIGSVLAMGHALRELGKSFTIIKGDSPMPTWASHLPGYQWITNKSFFEIDLADYDLFLILDSGSLNQISKIREITFPPDLRTVVIDHHVSNSGFAELNLIALDRPATAQILFELFKLWGIVVTPEIALNLYIGLHADTGGFKYPGTSSDSLRIAAKLAQGAPDFPRAIAQIENTLTPQELAFFGLALNSIETFYNDRLAIAAVGLADLCRARIGEEAVRDSYIANLLRSVRQWRVGICLTEERPGFVSVSLRSQDGTEYDVSKIATAVGGGGHPAAAGAIIKKPLAEAKADIVKAAGLIFNQK